MKERTKYELQGVMIVLALFAVLFLMTLLVQRFGDRLPKEQGVEAYLSFGGTNPQGKTLVPLAQGGCSWGYYDDGTWRSVRRYNEVADFGISDYDIYQPLSVWTTSEEMKSTGSFRIHTGEGTAYFAFRIKDKTKIESFSVKRWPLEIAGTDAVKEDSWTGREDVEYTWREGGLFSLSKGFFTAEPGYLYSIFVFWKSSEKPGVGWTEFSFTTEQAPQGQSAD